MRIVADLEGVQPAQDMILTIGAYDGLHRGHQALLSQLIRRSRCAGYSSGLITFHPHPRAVLQPGHSVQYLTTPGEKAALLERMNLDILVIMNFDEELASTAPRDFVAALRDSLRMRELWVGSDFALGRNREGNIDSLRALGIELGFELNVIEAIQIGGVPVRSSNIRNLLRAGEIRKANRLLGRHYSLSGEVARGAQRGRCLGFPTANLVVREERVIPGDGVYATCALVGTDRYHSVTNVGVRPTFADPERTIEVHILDFSEGLYGQDLVVEYVRRLRPERSFDSVDGLVAQMRQDAKQARETLEEECPNVGTAGGDFEPISGYEEVEHTADLALRVWGEDLQSLFIEAATGMFYLVGSCDSDHPLVRNRIELEASDSEALLVDWLNELLYLREARGACYCRFEIERLTPTSMAADVAGHPVKEARKTLKAATFHDLRIRHTGARHETVIVFDV